MKHLILTITYLVGFFTLPVILPWMAAFMPWALLTILVIGLIALSLGSNWQHYAASIDQALDFDRECGPEKPNRQKFDPLGGLERQDTRGGGVRTTAPTSKISTPEKQKHNSTKCISAGSGAGASRVENITQRGGECHPAIKNPLR